MIYLWTKTLHLLFVVAWLAAVFYLPRILVNVAEAAGQGEVRARLYLMGRRLYRFGHNMFGLAVLLGALLWFGHRGWPALWPNVVTGGWLHAKLGLVVVLLVYFIVTGRWLKAAEAGGTLPSSRTLRWFNELPVLVVLPVFYLVLAKPF